MDELLQDEAVVSFLIAVSDVDAYPAKTHLTRALKSYVVDEADVQVAGRERATAPGPSLSHQQ